MAKILKWIQDAAVKLVDPDREQRVAHYAKAVERELTFHKKEFNLRATVAKLQIDESDLSDITDRVYQVFLTRAWADQDLSKVEQRTLGWIAEKLEISSDQASRLSRSVSEAVFRQSLAHAMEDGEISSDEATRLRKIAEAMGSTLPDLMSTVFKREGESFLRSAFLKAASDGEVSEQGLQSLLNTTRRLGISDADLFNLIRPQARQLVEHILADAKSDGVLSADEDRQLAWALRTFNLPADFVAYLNGEVSELRVLTEISAGRLPTITAPPEIELHNGEIAHFNSRATFIRTKQLVSGPRQDAFEGNATITDLRLVFSSSAIAFSVAHRKVIGLRELQGGIELRTAAKGAGIYFFQDSPHLAIPIYRTAIGRANQTITARQDGAPNRHIPRDVRQRIWQRYNGHCAECGASDYLEFDHIVPVAKGGSNSENNVQLLCRRCNLRKSDNI